MSKIVAFYDDSFGKLFYVYTSKEEFEAHCHSMCSSGAILVQVFYNIDSVVFH